MTQRDAAASIQCCAARFARLAADGSTPAGATNGYLIGGSGAPSRQLVSLTVTPNVEEGLDFSERDACGGYAITYRERGVTKWYDMRLEIIPPDPELEEMLIAASLLTGTYTANRTVTDGSITSGSTTLTSPSANFTQYDVGAAITGTGIAGGATIAAIISATQVTMSAAATATSSAVSVTITAASNTIGATAPPLGSLPTDAGVSLEVWTKAIVGSSPAAKLPFFRWAFPRTQWRLADARNFANATQHSIYVGEAYENPLWGNGPFNDWKLAPGASPPSAETLSRAWGRHRTDALPTATTFAGYIAVPAQ